MTMINRDPLSSPARRILGAIRSTVSLGITRQEIWFENDFASSHADIVFVHHSLRPIDSMWNTPFKTILVDLTRGEDVLWKNLKKDTRNSVRRAEKDGVNVVHYASCTAQQLEDFARTYRELEIRKGLTPLDLKRLARLNREKILALSIATRRDGRPLSWHAYIVKGAHARLMNSVQHLMELASSEERSFVGRAHRLHIWRDIQTFQKHGRSIYDLGGYHDGDDPIQHSIGRFKEEFGGTTIPCYSAIIPMTWRGHIALRLRYLLSRQ